MGKDLHYSIRPFIEQALNNHNAVERIQSITLDDFYAYNVFRRSGMTSVVVVLSDDYHFGSASLQGKPTILKDGGFFLIAKPEASGFEGNEPNEKLGIGKIGKLLGALNREDFWNYEPPKKDEKK